MNLDDAYANGAYIDGAEEYPAKFEKAAKAFRKRMGAQAEIGRSYGDSPRQVYDLFQPAGIARGTVMFVHGGYWKAFDRSSFSHLAAGPLAKGWAVAMPSYDLCPDVRISDITRQIATALSSVADRTQGPIVLAGHSAGGHLVARMMDPMLVPADVRDRIKRIMPISPVADLVPLMNTTMNEILQIDAAEAEAESPVNMAPPRGVAVTVWVGGDERPAFLEQAETLARTWGARLVVTEGEHHFNVIDGLTDPNSDMVKSLLDLK